MKTVLIVAVAVTALALGGVWFSQAGNSGRDSVIKMSTQGASESDMLKSVQGTHHALSADDIILLKKANVPNSVVIEMLDRGSVAATK